MHGTREEVARVETMVNQLATALTALGDTDTLDSRRVKALVLMAHPAQACLTLARAYPPPDQATTEPHHNDEEGPEKDRYQEGSPQALAVLFGRILAQGGTTTLDRLRPRTTLYLHLTEDTLHQIAHDPTGASGPVGVARVRGLGPATLTELRTWLGHDHLTVRPVLDLTQITAVDAYEVPTTMREAVELLEPFEVFPYGTTPTHRADLDHTTPYTPTDEGGPPAQTHPHNLGPLSRRHHRAKTLGGFDCHQPLPGLYLWRTPTGHWYQHDHTGSHHLGRTTPDILRQPRPRPTSTMECALRDAIVEVRLNDTPA